MPNDTLQSQHLQCLRNEQQLFADLSFELNRGEILFVEGANGSGKTTLLRMLCGLREPDEGQILWNGQSIFDLTASYSAQVLYIGHHAGVKRDLTVEENLQMATALIATKPDLDLDHILEEVHLYAYADHPAGHLSAGQQRRVALARLLMAEARVWILDEPYTSLDKNIITWLESLFVRHVEAGGMIVLTSHQTVQLGACPVVPLRLGL